jgi:membrane protein DedA with SNARE-associated domain
MLWHVVHRSREPALIADAPHEWIAQYGYPGLFVLLMFGIIGVPIPDETLLAAAGFLIRKGDLDAVPTCAVCLLGGLSGITVSFMIGRVFGSHLAQRYGRYIRLNEERLARVRHWYQRRGRWSLTFGIYVPGVRHVIAIVAGTSELGWPMFALFAYSGVALWVSTFLSAGYLLGEEWQRASSTGRWVILIVFGAVVVAGLTYALVRYLRHRRSRRQSEDKESSS